MADRSHKTRQKMTFRPAPAKPRNPFVAPTLQRAAGPHRKSPGAIRAAARRAVRTALDKPSDDE